MNRREVDMAFDRIDVQTGWMTQYNVDHKFSSPYRVHELMRSISYLPGSLKSLEGQFKRILLHYFDPYTVEEWLEQNVDPMLKTVEDINSRAVALTSSISWPRRPLVSEKLMKDRKFEDVKVDVDIDIDMTTTTTTSLDNGKVLPTSSEDNNNNVNAT
jgi:hypothetical protein